MAYHQNVGVEFLAAILAVETEEGRERRVVLQELLGRGDPDPGDTARLPQCRVQPLPRASHEVSLAVIGPEDADAGEVVQERAEANVEVQRLGVLGCRDHGVEVPHGHRDVDLPGQTVHRPQVLATALHKREFRADAEIAGEVAGAVQLEDERLAVHARIRHDWHDE